jgi:retinol dehydrogenase 12
MQDQICLITGATAGIGFVTARALAQRGATIVLVARNRTKAQQTVDQLRTATGNRAVDFLLADLSVQAQIHAVAEAFQQRYGRLDLLINNAGALFMRQQESVDGIEMSFALNHLSYFLLTHLLMEPLRASPAPRIINVASDAHRGAQLQFDDVQSKHRYSGFAVYGRSKLANLLFTYELARRLDGSGMTANALHPGFVATNFATNNGWLTRLLMRGLLHRFALSPAEGAKTTIYLATAPDVALISGQYFVDQQPAASSPESYDLSASRRLWQISEQLTGISSAEFGLQLREPALALG